jgi:GNAT superfamily N-acetyltransferase
MPDMLVALYRLPSAQEAITRVREKGIEIRRANAWELSPTRDFITNTFSVGWADEATVGFSRRPISTYLAVQDGTIVGFGSYECTRPNYFGPTGVQEASRKQGIGAALLLVSLEGLRDLGYAYAIIGGAGPTAFYERICGAIAIPNSTPGIYTHLLRKR